VSLKKEKKMLINWKHMLAAILTGCGHKASHSTRLSGQDDKSHAN
jgi:hypothetical protein